MSLIRLYSGETGKGWANEIESCDDTYWKDIIINGNHEKLLDGFGSAGTLPVTGHYYAFLIYQSITFASIVFKFL